MDSICSENRSSLSSLTLLLQFLFSSMAESDRIVVDFAWKYVQLMQTSFDECQALLERADGEAPSREEIQRCENIVEFCKMEAGSLDIAYKQGKY